MGVKQIFIDDLREEFVRDYVFPMFRYAHAPAEAHQHRVLELRILGSMV